MANRSVLIVDDDPSFVKVMRSRMESIGLTVHSAHDGMNVVRTVARRRPDLVVLDVNMMVGNGLTVCAALAHDASLQPVPVIILTGCRDTRTIQRCRELGAHYLHKSPDLWETMQPVLADLLDLPELTLPANGRDDEAGTPTVLVIDDDPDISRVLQIKLRAHGVETLRAFNGMQGYWMALKDRPDVIVSDFVMPEGQGSYVLGRLKNHTLTKFIPVFILTGRTVGGEKDHSLERELLSLGADRFLTKPLDFEDLLQELGRFIELQPIAC